MTSFAGKTVVVTGGTGALGSAIVECLLADGARCRVPVFDPKELDTFAFADRVDLVHQINVTEPADVDRLYGVAEPIWASIHIAGGFAMAPIESTSLDQLMQMLQMNFVSAYLCSKAAVGKMRSATGGTTGAGGGRIVNVAARPALEPRSGAGMTAYVASKAAVAAFSQALGEEVKARGILVNAVVPSIIDTAANRAAMPSADHAAWPKPGQIAQTVAFLASPLNTVTSSALVPVYGAA